MADPQPLLLNDSEPIQFLNTRSTSLDVFRGLSVFLMILVDYGGSIFPIIAHAPWNGIHLADFVLPFFLFIAGISLSLVYKKSTHTTQSTWKALARSLKLFALGILLHGGYFHGVTSFTFGVDIQRICCLGILPRISIGYIVAALCEIWLSAPRWKELGFIKSYYWHWEWLRETKVVGGGIVRKRTILGGDNIQNFHFYNQPPWFGYLLQAKVV